MIDIACALQPMTATLVPERREEITTEGGLDLEEAAQRQRVGEALGTLRAAGVRTSLFINPDSPAIEAALELRADAIELHTGGYAERWKTRREPGGADRLSDEVGRIRRAAAQARSLGLDVHAGHGLTYENVMHIAGIPGIEELNIGHSVISRALLTGMERAVREMKALVTRAVAGFPDGG
jgi:pyridoxine 5-phosphate synthase